MDRIKVPTATLKPLAVMRVKLGESAPVGAGPNGNRLIINVVAADVTSDRLSATLAGVAAADWGTIGEGTLIALDVRLTLKTDDGEYIYVEYCGRGDLATGLLATAPTFQTGSEKYKWLNEVQAVAAGNANLAAGDLVYQLYEVKVTV